MPDPTTAAAILTATALLLAQTLLAWAACRIAGFNQDKDHD